MKTEGMIRAMVAAAALMPGLAGASSVLSATLDYVQSGTVPAGGTLTATIDDSYGGADTVLLTMNANSLATGEFISEWSWNLNPALDPTKLAFIYVSGQEYQSLTLGHQIHKADGDGYFDIFIEYAPPGDAYYFTKGEQSVYAIHYDGSPLTALDFNYLSTQKADGTSDTGYAGLCTAAHIQGISSAAGAAGTNSIWMGDQGCEVKEKPQETPEPMSIALIGLGLLGMATLRRRRAA